MTTELYKRHRPRTLDRMVGAEGTVNALKNMLAKGTLPHTLLFHGPSGCGKTTLARILATELQCHPMDLKELNCSDFRGIDTIRDISRTMHLSPAAGKVRIWILDEVHQLSKDGMNAALKILEDTPSHVFFFLATTDPQKLLKTILTRCCEMPVRLLTYQELTSLVQRVCKRENIELSTGVLDELVASSQGSARTALVLLDKIANLKDSEREDAIKAKMAAENEAIDLCRALLKKEGVQWATVAGILQNLKGDPEAVRWAVLGYARAVLLKSKNPQAYFVIESFKHHFYDSKEAGLAGACYECLFGS